MMTKTNKKLTDEQIQEQKTQKIMRIVARRASYYRENPQRFVKEYLGIELKTFQKILLYAMMKHDACYYIAARGQYGCVEKKMEG